MFLSALCAPVDFPLILPIENEAPGPINKLPAEIICEILKRTQFASLGICCQINKKWKLLASNPQLEKEVIYLKEAFSSHQWARCDAEKFIPISDHEEFNSLPANIGEILKRPFDERKSLLYASILVRIPKNFTCKIIGNLASSYFPNSQAGYECLTAINNFESQSEFSSWVILTEIISDSRGKKPAEQKSMVEARGYTVPRVLAATACSLAKYIRTREFLFSYDKGFTRCQELSGRYPICVGLTKEGLSIDTFGGGTVGIAGLLQLA